MCVGVGWGWGVERRGEATRAGRRRRNWREMRGGRRYRRLAEGGIDDLLRGVHRGGGVDEGGGGA